MDTTQLLQFVDSAILIFAWFWTIMAGFAPCHFIAQTILYIFGRGKEPGEVTVKPTWILYAVLLWSLHSYFLPIFCL